MTETLVIALGGNAITRPGESGAIPLQFAHTAETLEHLKPLFHTGSRIAITHGSGPQIGNILIRVEEGTRRVPHLRRRLPGRHGLHDPEAGLRVVPPRGNQA
jgi:carbamate kinase